MALRRATLESVLQSLATYCHVTKALALETTIHIEVLDYPTSGEPDEKALAYQGLVGAWSE